MTEEQRALVEALSRTFRDALVYVFMNEPYLAVEKALDQAKISVHREARRMTNKEAS